MASRQATLEYLTTTKIGEKGQLTVPKQFRKDLGLGTGAPFAVLRLGDGLVLLPEQHRFERLCEQLSSALTGAGLTPESMRAELSCSRSEEHTSELQSRLHLVCRLLLEKKKKPNRLPVRTVISLLTKCRARYTS